MTINDSRLIILHGCEGEKSIIAITFCWARSLIPRYHQHFTQVWAPTKLLFQQGLNKLAGTGIVGSLGWGCEGGGLNFLTSKWPYIDPFVIPHRGKAESTAMDPALDEFCCDKRDGFVSTKKYTYILS